MSWIDDIGPGDFFKGIADAVKGNDGAIFDKKGLTDVSKGYEENAESLKKLVQQIKDTTKTSKMLATALEGGKVAVPDFTDNIEQLNKTLEENNEKIKKAGNAHEARALEEQNDVLQQRKRAVVRGQIEGTIKASAVNLVAGFASASYGLVVAGLDLTKGIIEGQDAITTATQAQIAAIKATAQMGSTIGDTVGSLGGVASMLGLVSKKLGPFGALLGFILTIAGPMIKMVSEKSAELATKGLEILSAQLKQVRKGFFDLNASGVTFANGMTGMVQQATRAGLRVEDFASVVKESEEQLRGMGGGITLASQRLAGISGEIRKSNIGKQLNNLGIELKDQAKVAAAASAQLNASGRLRMMSDQQVAEFTVKYARDLKVLQAIAGKDAEKALEKARQEAMAADVRAKILREGGKDALTRFEAAYAATPEALRKGLIEKISLGSVVDVGTNVAMQANKGIGEFYDNITNQVYRGGSDYVNAIGKAKEQLGASAAQISEANRSIGMAATATGDSMLNAVREINSAVTMIGVEIPKGTTDATGKIVDAAQATGDKLTNAVYKLDKASNDIAVGLQSSLLPAITSFADKSRMALDTIAASLAAVKAALTKMDADAAAKIESEKEKGFNENFGEAAGGAAGGIVAGAVTGGLVGSFIPVVGTAIGAIIGGALGAFGGSKLGGWIGKKFDEPAKPPASAQQGSRVARSTQQQTVIAPAPYTVFAKGGITDRAAIFGEAGPEAAVPLPDGRNIPVNLSIKGKAANDMNPLSTAATIMEKLPSHLAKFLDPMGLSKAVTGRTQPLAQSAPGADLLGFANKINEDIAKSSRVTAEPVATNRRESERTVDDIALLMESQLSKQEAMIKTLKDILTVNKGMLSAYS